jgi:hypothetical protein
MAATTPSEQAVEADLTSAAFRAGVSRGCWRKVSYTFPILVIGIAAVEPDGTSSEYYFRFELTGFPATGPHVTIWDLETNQALNPTKRPKGTARVTETFKEWGHETVYRPWDRLAGPHNNWSNTHPSLAWNPLRHLTFILGDIHGLLTSNTLAQPVRQAT